MNEDTAKGTLDKVTGKIKEGIGNLTNDEELKQKGKLEQVKGSAEQSLGNAKDAGKSIADGVTKATE